MQQASIIFHRYRLVFAGLFITAFLVAISNVVTAIGAGSMVATHTTLPSNPEAAVMYDSSNSVTAFGYKFADSSKQAMFSMGANLYRTCKAISLGSAHAGKTAVHDSATAAVSTGKGVVFLARSFASLNIFIFRTAAHIALFPYRAPVRLASAVSTSHGVSSIIRPADTKTVPVISHETSAAALAQLSALQQQEITKLQAAQLAANERLAGSVIAGDSNHGGYPAKWDFPARQDSMLDNWGMYNRECVSYTAWKVYQAYSAMPYWGGVGNANEWVGDARRAGIPTSTVPKEHSVAISMAGYYGHAMWVEKVSGDMIYVSQYNYDLHGHYSEMWLKASGLTYIYFH
ncbi:MAG TPA: CHAP domain-containing protein [Candidatus Saccharimonadales bacterium]|nr:CHAP domain-containing protein [Candidatus Saccharimonadales bacterium]